MHGLYSQAAVNLISEKAAICLIYLERQPGFSRKSKKNVGFDVLAGLGILGTKESSRKYLSIVTALGPALCVVHPWVG